MPHDVCRPCRKRADCTYSTYIGRGVFNVSRSNPPTWHGPKQPAGVDFLEKQLCIPDEELTRQHAVLPVTHVRAGDGAKGTIWFYYARGCSDMGWGMGRTLLARNRQDLAIKLQQRLYPGTSRKNATGEVAAALRTRAPHWAAKIVAAAKVSQSANPARYWADARARNRITLEGLLADAAEGFVVPEGNSSSGNSGRACQVVSRRSRMRGSADFCGGLCSVRALALISIFYLDGAAMDPLNTMLLRALCGSTHALDSVKLHQQPSGTDGRWATEIWDTAHLCVEHGDTIPVGPAGELAGGPVWLHNGSWCARTPHAQFRECYACSGSELQQDCRLPEWRRPGRK